MSSSLGSTKEANWAAVLANKCAIKSLVASDKPDYKSFNCQIGGPMGTDVFNPADHPTSFKFRTSSLAAYLAKEAIYDSGMDLSILSEAERRKTGVLISS